MEPKRKRDVRAAVIRTPGHHLRVFVSSTLQELAAEREAARQAIFKLRLVPVMFESGARPHPAQELYQAYLGQSHVFVGIYWQRYGWIGPGMKISGLEDEYNLSAGMPRLIYVKNPAPEREPALTEMLGRIEKENLSCYKFFGSAEELRELVENDLALLLTESFETASLKERATVDAEQHPPGNVPVPRNPFVGREQELEGVRDLLARDDVGLVTLTGPAGTGKSRLSIQLALGLRDLFPDGIYFVRLESVSDAELVIPAVAMTLGVTGTAGGPPLLDTLKSHLSNKNLLLLLDNFEHVLDAAPRVAELLEASPGLKILATSRARLRLRAEKEFPVPPLAVPPPKQDPDVKSLLDYSAVQLLVQRAQSAKPDFAVTKENAPAVAQICRGLDGLPLAIELAAARVRMLSPQSLLSRLQHCFEVLRGGAKDLPERHRTLHGAITWSYDLLKENEKRLLRRLSVFVGGWTLEAANAVSCAGDEDRAEVLDGLEALIDNSMVGLPEDVDNSVRFKMLQTLREFAYRHLIESGEADTIHGRHADYYAALAQQVETGIQRPARQAWYRQMEADLDNLRAAMDWSLSHDRSDIALRIAAALWEFWETHGYWREGLEWLEKGLASGQEMPEAIRAKALNRAGWLKRCLGDYSGALAMLEESLGLWRRIGDEAGIALTLSIMGTVVQRFHDYEKATAMFEEALKLRRQLGDLVGSSATLLNLGLATYEQGDYAKALQYYSESLELARAAGDDTNASKALNNMGEILIAQGEYKRAEACYAEMAVIDQRVGNRVGLAIGLGNRGVIALKKGDYSHALELLTEATVFFNEFGSKEHTIACIELLGVVAKEQHHPERAARLLAAGESLRKSLNVARAPVEQTEHDARVASVRRELGEPEFQSSWSEGSRMTLEQAVAYAGKAAE